MISAKARVATERASLRLAQLCRHVSKMRDHAARHRLPAAVGRHGPGDHRRPGVQNVEWSDTRGVIDGGWGRCTLTAEPDALVLHVEAADEEGLRRLQEMVARRVETIGSREGLKVVWEGQAPEPEPGPATGGIWSRLRRKVRHWKYRLVIGAGSGGGVVGSLVSIHTMGIHPAGGHLLLVALAGAAVVALSRWLEWGPAVVVVLLAAVLLVLVRAFGLHRLLLRRGRQNG
jgi:hypothetical protein